MKKFSHFLSSTEGRFIAFIVALVALSFAYYFYAMRSGESGTPQEVTVSETDHVRGSVDGTVTLVEFGDFQCPACAAYEPIVREVVAQNSDSLKFVFKHFPLTQIHTNALLSAKASEAAGMQGKFWEMHDMLYDKQKEWSAGLNARDAFIAYASTLGLDVEKFKQDLSNDSIEEKVFAEYREGVGLGVRGTPTFFLNGKMISNPGSLEEFNVLIQKAKNGTVQ